MHAQAKRTVLGVMLCKCDNPQAASKATLTRSWPLKGSFFWRPPAERIELNRGFSGRSQGLELLSRKNEDKGPSEKKEKNIHLGKSTWQKTQKTGN